MAKSEIAELESRLMQRDAHLENLEAEVVVLTEQKCELERLLHRSEARAEEASQRAEDEQKKCLDSEARATLAESCLLELEGRVIKSDRNADKATQAWLREAQLKDEALRRAEIAEQQVQNLEVRLRAMEREVADTRNKAAELVRVAETQAQTRIRSADQRTEAAEQRLFSSQSTASSLISARRRSETPQSRNSTTVRTPRTSSSTRLLGQSSPMATPTKTSTYWSFQSRSQSLGLRTTRDSIGSNSRISTKASTPPSVAKMSQNLSLDARPAPMADTPTKVQQHVKQMEEQMRSRVSGARSTTESTPKGAAAWPVFGSPESSQGGSPSNGARSMTELREASALI